MPLGSGQPRATGVEVRHQALAAPAGVTKLGLVTETGRDENRSDPRVEKRAGDRLRVGWPRPLLSGGQQVGVAVDEPRQQRPSIPVNDHGIGAHIIECVRGPDPGHDPVVH